jgi:competence transcription factor ComK
MSSNFVKFNTTHTQKEFWINKQIISGIQALGETSCRIWFIGNPNNSIDVTHPIEDVLKMVGEE